MTAIEARALTEARLAETGVDRVLRLKVYPAIAAACEKQCGFVVIKGLYKDPITLVPAHGEVACALALNGYTVRPYETSIDGPSVEVSW